MRYAVISDVHSNLEALEAVLSSIEEERVDAIVSLGDIVGYGADPVECISIMREMEPVVSLVGNHDHASVGRTDISYFNINARRAVIWTMEHIGEDDVGYLEGLPLVGHIDRTVLVHASLVNPSEWNYILTGEAASICFDRMDENICLTGHSHSPVIFSEESYYIPREGKELELKKGKYIVNVGSVGQPRDGDPRSRYVIYDSSRRMVSYRAVEYDIEGAREKIIKAGLPHVLGDRLLFGH